MTLLIKWQNYYYYMYWIHIQTFIYIRTWCNDRQINIVLFESLNWNWIGRSWLTIAVWNVYVCHAINDKRGRKINVVQLRYDTIKEFIFDSNKLWFDWLKLKRCFNYHIIFFCVCVCIWMDIICTVLIRLWHRLLSLN